MTFSWSWPTSATAARSPPSPAAAGALPRLDTLVFTGGIGEHAARLRQAIVARLGVLGLRPIEALEMTEDGLLTDAGEPIAILRIEAREDALIAGEVERLLKL